MLYNPSNPFDIEKAINKIKYFAEKNKVFEIIEKKEPKTYPQLKYAHLIIGWFALDYGDTLEFVKLEYFKKLVNKDVFEFERVNVKTAEIRIDYRSMASLNKDELSLCITRFRDYSLKENNLYLPEPTDLIQLREIEIQINNNRQFL